MTCNFLAMFILFFIIQDVESHVFVVEAYFHPTSKILVAFFHLVLKIFGCIFCLCSFLLYFRCLMSDSGVNQMPKFNFYSGPTFVDII